MATQLEIVEAVVRPLTANYGEPKGDPEAFKSLLLRTLQSFSVPSLERAVERLVMTRKFKTWPTIAEIVEAARKINGEDTKTKYPTALSGITKENFFSQSQTFVERDFEARGTCLEYVRMGTAAWEAWAVYFIEYLGFRPDFIGPDKIGWYAPTKWPSQFDKDVGLKADKAVANFEEYDPQEATIEKDPIDEAEERKNIVEMWQKLREDLLKSARKQTII